MIRLANSFLLEILFCRLNYLEFLVEIFSLKIFTYTILVTALDKDDSLLPFNKKSFQMNIYHFPYSVL